VVTTWIGDPLRKDEPFRYKTNHQGKQSTDLSGWGYGGTRSRVG